MITLLHITNSPIKGDRKKRIYLNQKYYYYSVFDWNMFKGTNNKIPEFSY